MNRTKKLIALLLVVFLLTSLVACGTKSTKCKVTFVFGEGIDNQTTVVFSGSKVSQPQSPQNGNKVVEGWYLHANLEESSQWNFESDRVQYNVTLYAKWTTKSTANTPTDPTPEPEPVPFEDYGMPVIDIYLADVHVTEEGIYTSMEEVGAYIYLYHKLPSNFSPKSTKLYKQYTSQNKYSAGGDTFNNNENLLPKASGRTYTECDINYTGGGRNSQRIVFSSDWLVFYTSDHYASYSILRFHENNS